MTTDHWNNGPVTLYTTTERLYYPACQWLPVPRCSHTLPHHLRYWGQISGFCCRFEFGSLLLATTLTVSFLTLRHLSLSHSLSPSLSEGVPLPPSPSLPIPLSLSLSPSLSFSPRYFSDLHLSQQHQYKLSHISPALYCTISKVLSPFSQRCL